VKNTKLECKSIFVTAPSLTELEHRLRARSTEPAEKIKIRLENAAKEIAFSEEPGNFDFILVNDDLEDAYQEFGMKLQEWYPHLNLVQEQEE
jgi:guanylate kinase